MPMRPIGQNPNVPLAAFTSGLEVAGQLLLAPSNHNGGGEASLDLYNREPDLNIDPPALTLHQELGDRKGQAAI